MIINVSSIITIVRSASSLMVKEGFSIEEKGTVENIVTSTDIAVQHFLMKRLSEILPNSGFLCEEEDFQDTAHQCVWIIDPIDGTTNYARGNENCGISVALVKNGVTLVGVVYSPWREQLWYAEKGRGAFCNGHSITVSKRQLEQSLMYTAMSTYRKEYAQICSDIIMDVYRDCNDVRRLGSAAVELCQIATGQAELFFEMRLMPWDYAAAALIIQEAGGYICDFWGKFPSLEKPTLVMASNTLANLNHIQKAVHRHLRDLPY